MLRFGQKLMLLLVAFVALQTVHGWLVKLPKLESLVEKLEEKKEKDLRWLEEKKLDFLNFFSAKEEAKKEKKEDEWDKFKQWWEEKKEKELSFFETKKENKLDKLAKKASKKGKPTPRPCCYGYAPEEQEQTTLGYPAEEEEEEPYPESEEATERPCKQSYGNSKGPKEYRPSSYDVRDDSAEGIRYFT
ncbi:protein PXR1 [Drosophila obscura]|uniref:protein PXR1 n=1 Tax=Drosophila obscura TaxID=7282 RepID=UPI001BB20128|nr:protein PXR1 [Drosophila obscura]